jgi:2-keto-3-deoxy-L-rhamnonate aldolase RhmA
LPQRGAEFVLYDMEHTGLGFETLKTQFALCRGLPLVPMVRVPRGEYHFIARALDVGALGVMVPMVNTAEERPTSSPARAIRRRAAAAPRSASPTTITKAAMSSPRSPRSTPARW